MGTGPFGSGEKGSLDSGKGPAQGHGLGVGGWVGSRSLVPLLHHGKRQWPGLTHGEGAAAPRPASSPGEPLSSQGRRQTAPTGSPRCLQDKETTDAAQMPGPLSEPPSPTSRAPDMPRTG